MMRKNLKKALLLGMAGIMGISLVACGGGDSSSGNELTNNGDYVFATGGTSGTYYPLGGAIANIENTVNKDIGFNVTVNSTGASKENIMLISKGEADFAIVQNDVTDYATNGEVLFDSPVEGIATVASIYPEVVQVVVAADSGINTISDLAGKRVSIGDAGSGVEANALQVLSAYGLTTDDISVNRLSFKESGNAFKDGAIDAFFVTAGVPNTAVSELAVTRALKLVDIAGSEADSLIADYPFYTKIVIPKDMYGTEKDIETVGVRAIIICRSDLNEEEVYLFTKAIYDNLDSLSSAHAKGKEFKLEEAADGVTVSLHPGAAKYYKEAGLDIS